MAEDQLAAALHEYLQSMPETLTRDELYEDAKSRRINRFDAKLDGNDVERLQLKGKPAPDMFESPTRSLPMRLPIS